MLRITIPEEHAGDPKAYVNRTFASDIIGAAMTLYRTCYANTSLSLREFEGARMRVAEINGCLLCQEWRSGSTEAAAMVAASPDLADRETILERGPAPSEEYYAAVSLWRTAPIYTERERLAIGFAEYLSVDPQGLPLDEDFWARLHAVYTDGEIVELAYCSFAWLQGRVTHALGLDGACSVGGISGALTAGSGH
jgi:alkylhydroperoxidase family enzyme